MEPISIKQIVIDKLAAVWAGIPLHYLIAFTAAVGLSLVAYTFLISLINTANNAARGDLAFYGDERWANGKLKRFYHENGKSRKYYDENGELKEYYRNERKRYERDVERMRKIERKFDAFGETIRRVDKYIDDFGEPLRSGAKRYYDNIGY